MRNKKDIFNSLRIIMLSFVLIITNNIYAEDPKVVTFDGSSFVVSSASTASNDLVEDGYYRVSGTGNTITYNQSTQTFTLHNETATDNYWEPFVRALSPSTSTSTAVDITFEVKCTSGKMLVHAIEYADNNGVNQTSVYNETLQAGQSKTYTVANAHLRTDGITTLVVNGQSETIFDATITAHVTETTNTTISSEETSLPLATEETSADGYELVWAEEFDYTGKPDPAKWTGPEGYRQGTKIYFSVDQCTVTDGKLEMLFEKASIDNPNNPSWEPAVWPYTACEVNTMGLASFTRGRFEVRAKLMCGDGLMSALWLEKTDESIDSSDKGFCEIDFIEQKGTTNSDSYVATTHANTDGVAYKSVQSANEDVPGRLCDDYHVYAVEWDNDKITYFLDGVELKWGDSSVPVSWGDMTGGGNVFDQPMAISLMQREFEGWAGPIDDNALPAKMYIDYVRVYQKNRKVGTDPHNGSPWSYEPED